MPWNDDPDAVARELNLLVPGSRATPAPTELARLEAWLRQLVTRQASDLLLVAGAPASIRVDGLVSPLDEGVLDGLEIEQSVLPALPRTPSASTKTSRSPTPP